MKFVSCYIISHDIGIVPNCGECAGEDVNGMSFQGADEELLRRALGILEDQGKCEIFQGDSSSEDGIKFF